VHRRVHQRPGTGAKLDKLATSLCAVLVAQACNVGYKPLVDDSNPALREARLRYVAQRYPRPETLTAANARIADVHAKLPLAERWGGGEVASIDGLRFVVPRRTIHAAYNRRYFGRRRGVTLLGTTADHYAGLHTVVITGTQPDAPYILDGLLDPQTSVRPREIMTDTAGYTDVIFGLFRLLGYQYSPRLADAGGATFWRINPTDYGPLNSLVRHQVNTHLIEQHYDDLLRVAGSLLQRCTTASQLVRALRSHTRHLASLALQHVGRAAKTIHLLDYCNDQPFRRRILTQLNRGESRHALARDICHGHRGELRQRYRQGQEEQLGALGLILNAIVLLQHDLHPTRPRPPRHKRPAGRRRRRRAPQPARQRPPHTHRPLPHHPRGGPARPRRLPRAQRGDGPHGLTRFRTNSPYTPYSVPWRIVRGSETRSSPVPSRGCSAARPRRCTRWRPGAIRSRPRSPRGRSCSGTSSVRRGCSRRLASCTRRCRSAGRSCWLPSCRAGGPSSPGPPRGLRSPRSTWGSSVAAMSASAPWRPFRRCSTTWRMG
jgi:TnpA family transposase